MSHRFRVAWREVAVWVLLSVLLGPSSPGAPAGRPNLVFVFSDQQSWDMLGCYGNRDIRTPHFDDLARQGVRFNHCISQSPVCTPFRSMLFSGQHPLNTGGMQNDLQMLPGNGTYLGEVLRDAGYHTGYCGKWHLYGGDRVRGIPPGPYRYGFDDEFIVNNCTLLYDAARAYYWDQDGVTRRMYGDWEPYAQTRQAMEFIDRHAAEPFALFLSWHPPHSWGKAHEGYDAPEDVMALYDPAKLSLRPTVVDTPRVRLMVQGHMAMISSLDRAFGQLMEKLDERGLAKNTIVVFTADHGDMLMSYGWTKNKGRVEHESSRVPLLVRWPAGLKPGVSDLLVGSLDLMPTLLGMMQLPVPVSCQGRNAAAAVIEGRTDDVDVLPMFYLPGNWRGVYTRRYTYSESLHKASEDDSPDDGRVYNVLYDREADPWETRNLFDVAEFAPVRATLHALTLEKMRAFGDDGMNYADVQERAILPTDYKNVRTPPQKRPKGWEGRLKGRPVDLLKGSSTRPAPAAMSPSAS